MGIIPALDQRVFVSRDESSASRSALMTGIAYYEAGITLAMVGATVTVLVPNLKVPQMAYPMLIAMILPTGVTSMVLSGLMAAVMSNVDSMLLAPAMVVARNIFADLFGYSSDRTLLTISRLSILAIGCTAIAVAMAKPDIIYWLILAFEVLFALLFISLTLGLYWTSRDSRGKVQHQL